MGLGWDVSEELETKGLGVFGNLSYDLQRPRSLSIVGQPSFDGVVIDEKRGLAECCIIVEQMSAKPSCEP